MATRLYFPAVTTPAVTPVANGAWGSTTGVLSRSLNVAKIGTLPVATAGSTISWATSLTAQDRIFVSPPIIGNQSIGGTLQCYFCPKASAGANARDQLEVYVVSNDGLTVRGTMLSIAEYGVAANLNTTNRNKSWANGDTISSINVLDGDRIVVVVGYTDVAGTTPSASSFYGGVLAATDIVANETGVATSFASWIEFSTTFAFYSVTQAIVGSDASGSGTAFTSTSKTITGGKVQLLCIVNNLSPVPSVPTGVDGTNLGGTIFTQIATAVVSRTTQASRVTLFWGVPAATVTGTFTANFATGQTQINYYWQELTNADPVNPIVQVISGATVVDAATLTLNFPNVFKSPDNVAFSFWANLSELGVVGELRAGWCLLQRLTGNLPGGVQFRCNADTAASLTTGVQSQAGIAVEIRGFWSAPPLHMPALSLSDVTRLHQGATMDVFAAVSQGSTPPPPGWAFLMRPAAELPLARITTEPTPILVQDSTAAGWMTPTAPQQAVRRAAALPEPPLAFPDLAALGWRAEMAASVRRPLALDAASAIVIQEGSPAGWEPMAGDATSPLLRPGADGAPFVSPPREAPSVAAWGFEGFGSFLGRADVTQAEMQHFGPPSVPPILPSRYPFWYPFSQDRAAGIDEPFWYAGWPKIDYVIGP